MDSHPSREDFSRFLQFIPEPSASVQNAAIVRHLLKGCPTCLESLASLPGGRSLLSRLLELPCSEPQTATPPKTYNYDWAFARTERAVATALAKGISGARWPAKWLELDRLSEGEQVRRAKQGGSFSDPELIEFLIDRSHASRYQNPKKMLHLSHLAFLASEALPPLGAGETAIPNDLQAQARGAYGNALRVCGRLQEAEVLLSSALEKCKEANEPSRTRAQVLTQLGSLRTFQRCLSEAARLTQEAAEIFHSLGDSQGKARALVTTGVAWVYSAEPGRACEVLSEALSLIDQQEDPQLHLAAFHNLARCYLDLGRPDEALSLFVEARPLYQKCQDPLILLRATWQEGQLLREVGHLESAEAALLRAREGFAEQGLVYETAVVSLDLAEVYLKAGRMEDLRRVVRFAIPLFQSLQVSREVLASLLRLRQAADLEGEA